MSPVLRQTFRSFRVRNYRIFATGQLISLTGTWMQMVGQDWLVLSLGGHGVALGVVAAGITFILLAVGAGMPADQRSAIQVQLLVWIFVMRLLMVVTSGLSYFLSEAIARSRYSTVRTMNFEAPLTALVWIASITSSTVMTPMTWFDSLTTGTTTRS